jgi:hypothetical protein
MIVKHIVATITLVLGGSLGCLAAAPPTRVPQDVPVTVLQDKVRGGREASHEGRCGRSGEAETANQTLDKVVTAPRVRETLKEQHAGVVSSCFILLLYTLSGNFRTSDEVGPFPGRSDREFPIESLPRRRND